MRITSKTASSIQWTGKPHYTWDDELKGFGVWVWGPDPSSRAYIVQAKHRGKSYRKTLGKVGDVDASKARDAAIAFKSTVRAGDDPHAPVKAARGAWTLGDAMDHFRGTHNLARRLSHGHLQHCESMFAHHTPDRWKTLKLTEITQGMIALRHREITGGVETKSGHVRGGSRRANYWLALMSRLFTLGIAQGHCTINPCIGVKKNPETHRDRYLSARELATLWAHLENHKNVEAAVCVQFILLTGCRPGEAFTMKWSDLDRGTGTWRKPATGTKQRRQHTVRLTDRAVATLGKLDTYNRSAYIFPAPNDPSRPRGDKLRAFWRHVRLNCALPDVRLYDCRHSFASWLAMGGATELEIAAQLGHSNVQTTRRYVHIAAEHLRAKAGIMGEVIAKALEEFPPDQRPIVVEQKRNGTLIEHCATFTADGEEQVF